MNCLSSNAEFLKVDYRNNRHFNGTLSETDLKSFGYNDKFVIG